MEKQELETYDNETLVAMVATVESEINQLAKDLEQAVIVAAENKTRRSNTVSSLRKDLRLKRGVRSGLLTEIQARQRAATGNQWRDVVEKDVQWKRGIEARLTALEGKFEALLKLLQIEPSRLKPTSGEVSLHLQHETGAVSAE